MTERKLLFRGFHPNKTGDTTITCKGKRIKGDWLYWNEIGELQGKFWAYYEHGNEYRHSHELDFIPETVGQWVMTDKNGKDVFEGDCVKWTDAMGEAHQGIVVYDEKRGGFIAIYNEGCATMAAYDYELIGNKWESEVTE